MTSSDHDLDRILHATLLADGLLHAEVAAFLADERGCYVAVNDQACTLTGYERTALTQFRAGELAADEASRSIYDNLATGKKMQGRKLVRRRDGALVQCRYWGIPTVVSRMPYFLVLLWPTGPATPQPS